MVDGGKPGVGSRDEGKHTGRNDQRCYVGLVAVGVQEQAEDVLVPPLLRNCLTLNYISFPSHYLPFRTVVLAIVFHCLGHSKNVNDDEGGIRTDNLLFGELQYLFAGARPLFLVAHRRPVDHLVGGPLGRRPLGGPPSPRPRPRQCAVEPDALNAGRQVPGDLVHAVEPPARRRRREAGADRAPTARRPVAARRRPVVAAGALARRRALLAAAATAVVVGGGGWRRRGPQTHPDHYPPPGAD